MLILIIIGGVFFGSIVAEKAWRARPGGAEKRKAAFIARYDKWVAAGKPGTGYQWGSWNSKRWDRQPWVKAAKNRR